MNERIKQIRRELGLTQTEFAERIGLKQNSIALIESGKRNISDQAVLSICREYGINEEWLRTGLGNQKCESINPIDKLADRYTLSGFDKVFIEKYVNLAPSKRKIVMDFIMDVASSIPSDSSISANKYENMDTTKETENILRGMELQKKAEEKSCLSCGGNMGGKNEMNA